MHNKLDETDRTVIYALTIKLKVLTLAKPGYFRLSHQIKL